VRNERSLVSRTKSVALDIPRDRGQTPFQISL